jgi:hypothetical protein
MGFSKNSFDGFFGFHKKFPRPNPYVSKLQNIHTTTTMGAVSPTAARLLVCGCAALSIVYSALTSKSLHQVDPALAQRKATVRVRRRRRSQLDWMRV